MTPSSPLMSIREVAAYCAVSTRTVCRWCEAGLIRFRLAGARKRFSQADVDAYLSRHLDFPTCVKDTETYVQ